VLADQSPNPREDLIAGPRFDKNCADFEEAGPHPFGSGHGQAIFVKARGDTDSIAAAQTIPLKGVVNAWAEP
jgi:hypothetical protein